MVYGCHYRAIEGKVSMADLCDEAAFSSDVTERTLAVFEDVAIKSPELLERGTESQRTR